MKWPLRSQCLGACQRSRTKRHRKRRSGQRLRGSAAALAVDLAPLRPTVLTGNLAGAAVGFLAAAVLAGVPLVAVFAAVLAGDLPAALAAGFAFATTFFAGFEADFFFDLASDFLPEYLQRSGERVRRLSDAAQLSTPEFEKIIHQSQAVSSQIGLARRIAAYEVPVLILGETGTGKELFAEQSRTHRRIGMRRELLLPALGGAPCRAKAISVAYRRA